MPPSDASARFGGIDCLRGLAALAVFFFHLSGTPNTAHGALLDAWNAVWRHGHLGVPLFFVISGVCIARTWLRSPSPPRFLRQRLRRIFPAYWGSLALIIAVALGVKLATGTNDIARLPRTLGGGLATLTLATAPVTPEPAMSGVYWSLSFELAFYGVMTLLLLGAETSRARRLALAHIALCAAAGVTIWPGVPGFFFVALWPLFGTGAALVLWPAHRRESIAMLVASAGHALVCVLQDRLVAYWSVAALGTAALAWVLFGPRVSWPRPLVALGEMSYSLYLFHVPLGIWIVHRLVPTFGPAPALEIARQLLIVAITLVAIRPFFRWLEAPFMRSPAREVRTPAASHAPLSA